MGIVYDTVQLPDGI